MNIAEVIAGSRMSRFQILAIVVAIVLTILEGYDTAMMVFAAPYVTKEFASSSSMIGVVLSGALIGMVIGSILVAPIADRVGRRGIAIVGTVIVLAGMLIAPFATDMGGILLSRIVTGLGVGALISVVGVIASEYSSRRAYPVVMAVYAAGINIGAVVGAVVIGPVLPQLGWRFAFWAGVVLSAIALLLAVLLFPESIAWLAARRKPGTLDRVNRMLARMGHPPLPELPQSEQRAKDTTGALRIVFSRRLIAQTLLMIVGYIAFLLVFYFVNSWAPNTLATATQEPSFAAPTTMSLGLGGVVGTLVFGFISIRVNPRILTPIFLVIGAIGVAAFGPIQTSIPFAFAEIFTALYSGEQQDLETLRDRMSGAYAWSYWGAVVANFAPLQLLWIGRLRRAPAVLFAVGAAVTVGMWLERYMLLVTTLYRDYLVSSFAPYHASFWEWSLFAGSIGLFMTLFLLFVRFLPMISAFEIKEATLEDREPRDA